MNFFRRTLTAIAPIAAGVVLLSGVASASTLLGDQAVYGDLAQFNVPNGTTISVAGFSQSATDAAIQAGCAIGHTCGAATLYEIDFSFTANVNATVTVQNAGSTTGYIGSLGNQNGVYNNSGTAGGGNTTGFALGQVSTLHLIDPNSTEVDEVVPTFEQATNQQFKATGVNSGCGSTGTASSLNFITCLSIAANSTQTYSGSGTDTETNAFASTDGTWASEITPYYNTSTVSFNVTSSGLANNGSLTTNTTIPGNSGVVQALTHAVEVDYLYSYTDSLSSPEPGTMVLLGGALFAVGMIRSKRRAS